MPSTILSCSCNTLSASTLSLEEIFSGEYYQPKYNTAVFVAGKGSGKSYLSSFALAYMWYWHHCFKNFRGYLQTKNIGWDGDSAIAFMGMAPSADKAKDVVFNYTKKNILKTKLLQERGWLPDPDFTSRLQCYYEFGGQKVPRLMIIPGNSNPTMTLGYAIYGSVIDESSWFKDKKNDPVVEIYKELDLRRTSRFGNMGITILITSPNSEDDLTESLIRKAQVEGENIYWKRKASYECNKQYFDLPTFELEINREKIDGSIEKFTINPPLLLKPYYDEDQNRAIRDINAYPAIVGSAFYADFMLTMSKLNRSRVDPAPDLGKDVPESPLDIQTRLPINFAGIQGMNYRIHIDYAKGSMVDGQCGCGFAMCHKEADPRLSYKVVLDLAVRFKAPKGKEVDMLEILNFIRWLKESRNFNIDKVTMDQYQSVFPIQQINAWNIGICAEQLKVGYKEHIYLKNLINQGQMDLYEDNNLLFELKRLEDFITSVEAGPTSHKDEADAVAGAAFSTSIEMEAPEVIPKRTAFQPVLVGRGGVVKNNGNPLTNVGNYRTIDYRPKYRQL